MDKKRVLFICEFNSARSQMAEAFLNDLGQGVYEAHSAGMEPSRINPMVVETMQEIGYDLSRNKTQSVFDLYRDGELYEYVVTVCDPEVDDTCPVFAGITERLNWPFPDPVEAKGTDSEKLAYVRGVRDSIKARVEEFILYGK